MAYSTAAFKLIDSAFEAVVSVAKVSMLARARMQVGAAFAGAAIENSMLGAAHAAANPLTARVVVNRIWMQLFGRGIVATENNFGATGTPPSHPELLDFLAVRFVEEGWSVKRTIRQILLSRTYQLSGTFDQRAYEIDPEMTAARVKSRRNAPTNHNAIIPK